MGLKQQEQEITQLHNLQGLTKVYGQIAGTRLARTKNGITARRGFWQELIKVFGQIKGQSNLESLGEVIPQRTIRHPDTIVSFSYCRNEIIW